MTDDSCGFGYESRDSGVILEKITPKRMLMICAVVRVSVVPFWVFLAWNRLWAQLSSG